MKYQIELMTKDITNEYARISTQSWVESYTGIIDNKFLDKINTTEEINKMKNNLIENLNDDSKRFLLKVDNEYVGLFRIRKTKYEGYEDYGELGALYLLNKAKKNRHGKIMFEYAKKELFKQGYRKMIIGCLDKNPTNDFYLHMGCEFVKTNPITIGKQNLVENIYILNIDY